MGRVYLILARLSVILFILSPQTWGQNVNNLIGNNQPFGNVNFNNGYVIVNGTKRFGPDNGNNYFQAALNSLAQPPNQFSGGGGDIAVYGFNFIPQTLQLTNKFNGTWHIHGTGVTSSGIIGPAPIINCNSAGGGYIDNDSQGRFVTEIDGLTIAGITNAVTNIIQLHNNGRTYIHDNWITCWTYATNHFVIATSPGFFLPFSSFGAAPTECDLVGINLTANFVDYQYIEHNSFFALACALDIMSYDHVRFHDNFLSFVGPVDDSSGATQLSPNLWPATQAESIGCAVIVRNGASQNNADFKSRNNYFYIGGYAYMFLNQGAVSPSVFKNCILEDDMTENPGGYILTDGYARIQVLNCPASKTGIGQNPFASFTGLGDCGIVSTNQFFITQTGWITNFPPVKKLSLNNSTPQVSEGLNVDNTVGIISQFSSPSITNAWISQPITLTGGVDPTMNGTWTFKGFDASLGVHTWTNPPNANYILWANTNATTYNPGTPGTLSQLILSTNVAAEAFTNIANWITSYTFNDSLGYCNQRYYNGFTNWVQVAYNTLGGTLNTPTFISAVTWTNNIISGISTTATNNPLIISINGVTNSTSVNFLFALSSGTSLILRDGNGNTVVPSGISSNATLTLKPGWRLTGASVAGIAYPQ